MKALLINEAGELEFDGQNSLRMVEGIEEKRQAVWLLLSTNLSEWFLNTEHGMAFYELLGQKNPSEELIQSVVLDALRQEPRFEELLTLSYEFNRAERNLTVNIRVQVEGETIEQEVTV